MSGTCPSWTRAGSSAWCPTVTSRSAVLHAADLAAGRIMARAPVTVTPATRVDHAALLLLEGCVGALLVVEGRALVGIVTYVDVLVALVHMLGTEPEERLGLAAS